MAQNNRGERDQARDGLFAAAFFLGHRMIRGILTAAASALFVLCPPVFASENEAETATGVPLLEGPPRLDEKTGENPETDAPSPLHLPLKVGDVSSDDKTVSDSPGSTPSAPPSPPPDIAPRYDEGTPPVEGAPVDVKTRDAAPTAATAEISNDTAKKPSNLGELEIDTEPENATVYLSGSEHTKGDAFDTTPLRLTLPPGQYYVTLEKDGFDTAVAEVTVNARKTTRLKLAMVAARSGAGKGLRFAGHLLFWPGLVTSVTGIALMVADDPKNAVRTGRSGGITAGVGVAMTVLGGIFLGVTYRDKSTYTTPVALLPLYDGKGALLSIHRNF